MPYATYNTLGGSSQKSSAAPPHREQAQEPQNTSSIPMIESYQSRHQAIISNALVVVYNYADWCGPCNQIRPAIERLCSQYAKPGVCKIVKEDVDLELGKNPDIGGVPCFHFYLKGAYQPEATVTGGDIDAVRSTIQEFLSQI